MGTQSSVLSVVVLSSSIVTSTDKMSDSFPEIKSKHSLVAKYVTEPLWEKLGKMETKTSQFTLSKAIACAVQFDNQHCGIYAGDWDSYKDFSEVFEPLIQEYHGISADAKHTSDMDATKIKGNINPAAPVHSTRIRVGRSIDGFGLSPGITKEQRLGVENLMTKAFANLKDDLAGTYFPLTGMNENVRQQLVDDHFLFVSGDPNLKVAVWRGIGLKVVGSSTIRIRPSSPGSMRKTSSGLSPCRRVGMLKVSLIVLPEALRQLAIPSKPSQGRSSCWTPSMATCTPAQQTWVLA